MKLAKTKAALLSVAAGTLITISSASAATVDVGTGDLVLGFRDTVSTTDFQFSLGSVAALRDNPNAGFLGNIGSFLSIYDNGGTSWYDSSTLTWGAVAATSGDPSAAALDGDPYRTVYFSMASGTAASSAKISTSSGRSTATTAINGLVTTMAGLESTTSDGLGVSLSDTYVGNNWSDYMTGSGDFSVLPNIEQTMSAISNTTYMGIANVEAILNVYRVLNSNTGADPTGTVGTGSYVTTLVITQSGDVYAVPEPSTYALLAIAGVAAVVFLRRRRQTLA